MYKRILIISDLHIPYHHKDSFSFLREIKKEYKPDFVINIGDLLDFHAINMHTHDPDLYSAGHELKLAKKFVKELESIFPNMIEVESNHSSLVYRRALKYGMSREFLKDYGEFLGTKKWKWVEDLTLKMSNNEKCFFTHGRSADILKVSQGSGIIIDGIPRLLPLVLNSKGDWIGKLV